jgi:hypothetical protein
MRMLLIRIGLGVGVVLLAEQWPAPVLLGVWALVVWSVPRAYRDYREVRELRGLVGPAVERVTKLRADLTMACAYSTALEQRITELESQVSSHTLGNERTAGHPLFRKVGLDQDCPRWVAEVVRREYRRRLHPDTKPAGQKVEAERRFKEMEAVFDEIWRVRGF